MKHRWLAILCALALTAACVSPTCGAEGEQSSNPQAVQTLLVGLAYGSDTLAGANLANDVGSGFLFGYLDAERNFQQVGYTAETALSVVKTQNVYYGYSYGNNLVSYSDAITSDVLVGCWHVQLPWEFATFEEAQELAASVGGFPAWIDGAYQVRLGAYGSQAEAQAAADAAGGTVAGTSAYGVSVVRTGTSTVLFQFDGGSELPLTVMPIQTGEEKPVTYFRGTRYYGGFQYRRNGGGNMTVINAVDMDDYINCLLSQEMSPSWPMEALKAQAVCARNYAENEDRHDKEGFDVCYTTDCQAYPGVAGSNERTAQATAETAGLRVWYQGTLAKTYYFASDGGGTEDPRNVWGTKEDYPYLHGVVDPFEETISEKIAYWDNQKTFTSSEFTAMLQAKGYNCATITDVQTELTPTGNVKTLIFVDSAGKSWPFVKQDGVKGFLGLKSIHYTVTKSGETAGGAYYTDGGNTLPSMNGVYAINGSGKTAKLTGNPYVITGSGVQFLPAPSGSVPVEGEAVFTFTSRGYGHNIGMSQWGAYAMAQQGYLFDEILKFYYPGVEIY